MSEGGHRRGYDVHGDSAPYTTPPPRRSASYNRLADAERYNEAATVSDGQHRRSRSYSRGLEHADRGSSRRTASRSSGKRVKSHDWNDLESGGTSSDNGYGRNGNGNGQSSCLRPTRFLWFLAICTVLFGPIGTVVTFLLLPSDDGPQPPPRWPPGSAGHMRVLHLSLAHSDVKARFVIDERSDWQQFMAGCAERLGIPGVARVTDATDHLIHTITDLVHEDNIVVYPLGSGNSSSILHGGGGGPQQQQPAGAVSIHASQNGAASARSLATSASLHATEAQCPARHPEFRVAMLIPLLGPAPPYLPYFVASAARSSPLVDWLVFHEHLHLPWEAKQLPTNVKFVDLGGGGLAELVGLKLGERLGLPLRNATTLLRSLRLLFDKWPRLVSEYKPTFGTVFEDFLSDYSHWGYCDLDMVAGNLGLFLEREELAQQDVVSYALGDADALYLRGAWTVHRNRPEVNAVWQRCAHLGAELEQELSLKVSALRQGLPLRLASSEGCYSYEAVRANLRVKIANKQAAGAEAASSQQVVFVGGAIWSCDAGVALDEPLMRELAERTGREPCRTPLPPLQRPVGGLGGLRWHPEGCGKWIPPEFRLCVADAASALPADPRTVAVYAVDGSFYAQLLEDAGLELANGCRQAAFFHFTQWKDEWAKEADALGGAVSRVAPLEAKQLLKAPPFRITAGGISLLSPTGAVLERPALL